MSIRSTAAVLLLLGLQSYALAQNGGWQHRPRAGWVCPNGNSFESCGHECKTIKFRMVDKREESTSIEK